MTVAGKFRANVFSHNPDDIWGWRFFFAKNHRWHASNQHRHQDQMTVQAKCNLHVLIQWRKSQLVSAVGDGPGLVLGNQVELPLQIHSLLTGTIKRHDDIQAGTCLAEFSQTVVGQGSK